MLAEIALLLGNVCGGEEGRRCLRGRKLFAAADTLLKWHVFCPGYNESSQALLVRDGDVHSQE